MNSVSISSHVPAAKAPVRDPGSALTHLIAAILAVIGTFPLLYRTSRTGDAIATASMTVFMISMILLYSASTTYHTINTSKETIQRFRKIDHMMIFLLIAGTYTPICLISLRDGVGPLMCAIVWGIALGGIVIKAFWITCPKWFSSLLYISMGWVCVMGFSQILRTLSATAFGWLLAGGIIYTVGGVIYALKLPLFNARHRYFGSHEIFHLFCIGGSLCHYIVMFHIL